jgi:hypothetical protein
VAALHEAQACIGREINPVLFSATEFREKARDAFLMEVPRNEKLFLMGDEHGLGKPVGDSQAGKSSG